MNDIKNIVENTLIKHTAFENASIRLNQCMKYARDSSEPICIAVIGESRTGKSRALEEFYIQHLPYRIEDGLYVPILFVKTPSKPTVKGFVELMLREIGDPRAESGTENSKTNRLKVLMMNAGTKLVVIDEFQHFYDKGTHSVMHYLSDWLKILVDDTKCCLVVAGLPNCSAVLDQNEQLKGRFLAPITLPRFDWEKPEQRNQLIAILSAFQESIGNYFEIPKFDSEEMAFRFYCATGGLIGYLSKILRQAVWNGLDNDVRKITLNDLQIAHRESIYISEGITQLRSPFHSKFNTSSDQENLLNARSIGLASSQASVNRKRSSNRIKDDRLII
jgi:hypothetical protein